MPDKLPVTATVGAAPPPDAPHEVSQPITAEFTQVALARAREHERELAPLTYGAPVTPPPAGAAVPTTGGIGEATVAAAAGHLDPFYARMKEAGQLPTSATPTATSGHAATSGQPIKRILKRRPPTGSSAGASAPSADPAPTPASPVPPRPDPQAPLDLSRMPAASNSDSPARGVPRNLPTDPGKAITGGFGMGGEVGYYALDGTELRTLVEQLMDEVYTRLQTDLRFNEAITYPQVTARVVVEIQGYASDGGFTVEKLLPPTHPARATTPVEFARTVADEVCFVVLAECRETDDQGQSVTPPDQVRAELGLQQPRKQIVRTGSGPGQVTMVDRRT